MKPPSWHHHPAVRSGDALTIGERAADFAVKAMGSLGFLIAQTMFIVVWVALNLVAFVFHWDPYPFILLNLAFSVQAAYAAPLVLLAGRRVDQRNSERAQYDLQTDVETLALVRYIYAHLKGIT